MITDDPVTEVRRRLNELRRRTGVRKGDEFDLILDSVEALALTIDAMTLNASAVVEEGQRSVGSIVSAAMTKTALWRVVVLPAVIAALVAVMIVGLSTTIQLVVSQRVIQADHDAYAKKDEADRVEADRHFEELRGDNERHQNELEADRQRLEATLPTELVKRAETLTGAARDIVRQEAASPGFTDFIARNGLFGLRAAQLNGGTLCPQTVYQGGTRYCEFRIE